MPYKFDVQAIATLISEKALPSGNYGSVYELWQKAYDRNILAQISASGYTSSQVIALKAELVRIGALTPPDTNLYDRDEGTCACYLDAQTCPNGCFE